MSMTAGIPPEALASAPRVWVGKETGFGRKVIDPKWITGFRRRSEEAAAAAEAAERIEREHKRRAFCERYLAGKVVVETVRVWASTGQRRPLIEISEPEAILRRFCGVFGVSYAALIGSRGSEKEIRVRQAAIYWMRRRTGQSMPKICREVDRDPATCRYACRAHVKRKAERGGYLRPVVSLGSD